MVHIIFLLLIFIFLVIIYVTIGNKNREKFLTSEIKPDMSNVQQKYMTYHEENATNCLVDECDRIDKFSNQFFSFRDRIHNNSHQDDPVDNINTTGNGRDYKIGSNISDVYDNLVNSYDYKTGMSKKCEKLK